jgi:hypothetical protein
MSSRYGRNKRRRAREEIKKLTEENRKLHESNTKGEQELYRVNTLISSWDDRIRNVLGKYSALRPDIPLLRVSSTQERGMKMRLPMSIGALTYYGKSAMQLDSFVSTATDLELLVVKHEKVRHDLSHLIRVYMVDPSGCKTIAMSYKIDGTSFLPELVGEQEKIYLAEHIADAFIQSIVSKKIETGPHDTN